jgi:hypothetical protein
VQDFDDRGFLGLQAQDFALEISRKHKDWFDLCSDINSFAQRSKYELVIHNMDGQEVISVCLFLRILNGFQACMILAGRGLVVQGEVLLRSMFEALFIMKSCMKDEDFMREYVKSSQVHQLRLMDAAFKHDADIFAETRKYASKEKMDELRNKKKRKEIKELNISKVAEKAGLGLLYDSAYRLLSDSVHCGPKSLEDYIKDTDEAGRIKSLNVIPIDIELNPIFMNAINVMFFTLDAIFEYFNLDKKKEMEALDLRFQNLVQIENKKYEKAT